MEYDAQPMHLDEEAGRNSILGGLAASGWHTCSMMMRMMTDSYLLRMAAEGAPGIDYVKWKKPVLAGDVLSGETRVLDSRTSNSRPGIGIVSFRHELRNQRGETVLEIGKPDHAAPARCRGSRSMTTDPRIRTRRPQAAGQPCLHRGRQSSTSPASSTRSGFTSMPKPPGTASSADCARQDGTRRRSG